MDTATPTVPEFIARLNLPPREEAAAVAAHEASDAVSAPHRRDWATAGHVCQCGQGFRRSQALGQHLSAVAKRASRAWDLAYARAMAS